MKYSPSLSHRLHIFRVVDEDDVLGSGVRDCIRRSPIVTACLSPILLIAFSFSTFTFTFLDPAFTSIDVLIVCSGLHVSVSCTSHNLCDLLLFLVELQFDQDFGDHSVDSIQGDARVSELIFGVQNIPDVANGAVVLDDSAESLNHKCNQPMF